MTKDKRCQGLVIKGAGIFPVTRSNKTLKFSDTFDFPRCITVNSAHDARPATMVSKKKVVAMTRARNIRSTPAKPPRGSPKRTNKAKPPRPRCIFHKHHHKSRNARIKKCNCGGTELREIPHTVRCLRLFAVKAANKAGDSLLWCKSCAAQARAHAEEGVRTGAREEECC